MFANDTVIFQFTGPFAVRVEVGQSLGILVLFIALMSGGNFINGLTFAAMLVAAIILHEFGHAVGCLVQGVPVRRVMITGDRWSPARRVAEALGITDFTAEALPGDKLELVETLKAEGHTVAVVGDGVNDGPALAAGDVSIAMGAAGSDVAINSASIALMNNNLNRIPFLVGLSAKTVTVIRQNLIGTLVYILLMVALLLAGYMEPWIAAVGHGISSIVVIFNSARLVREGEAIHEPEEAVETSQRARRIEHVGPAGAAAAPA